MQLYALGLVKDEADVLEATIRHAATFCDRIIYLDNGSTDGSWEIIQSLAAEMPDQVIADDRTLDPFTPGMRNRIYNAYSDELGPDAWWFNLDSDEFLDVDPREAIAAAVSAGDDGIRTWQVQFMFTDADEAEWEAGREDPSRPIQERRRHYRIDWREARLWQNKPGQPWVDNVRNYPESITRFARHSLFNRHYQYRTPEQIQHRLDVRRGDRHFLHEQGPDWRSVVIPASDTRLHVDGDPWRVDWRHFLENQARMRARMLRAKFGKAQPAASRSSA